MTASARHSWNSTDPKSIAACDSLDGNDRTEKTCAACGLVKITVHPPRGLPWREWRTKAGKGWVRRFNAALHRSQARITGRQ
jgi:hypothetical protein